MLDMVNQGVTAHLASNSYFSFNYYKRWFQVDHAYVFKKLRLLCFPFLHASWERIFDQTQRYYLPPNQDINSPDGYLPCMLIATYILLMGYMVGQTAAHEFSPEVMITSGSSAAGM